MRKREKKKKKKERFHFEANGRADTNHTPFFAKEFF
jgi:hypothetical protein